MKLTVSTKRVASVLVLAVLCLTLASLFSQLYRYIPGLLPGVASLFGTGGSETIELFDVYGEGNIPTWYSSSALLLCSMLLALISVGKNQASDRRYVLHWRVLAGIFLLLSLDETAQLHDKVDAAMDRVYDFGGFFTYAWVIPAAAFLLIFMLAYLGFLAHLPVRTRWFFLVAASIYVGGAVGLEMVAGRYEDLSGISEPALDTTLAMLASGEELLEMAGIVIFVYALTSYISTHFKDLHVIVDE